MLCVCFWSGPWSHGVGNQATECRDRGTGSHSTWDHAHPPGGCGHWEMTPTSLFQHSLRDYKPLQPASLYNALVLGYIHPSHTIYIRYIFNTKPQHKGILWSVFLGDAAWQDRHDERLRKDHCYLCVWKYVALAKRYQRHQMNWNRKTSAKADTLLFVQPPVKALQNARKSPLAWSKTVMVMVVVWWQKTMSCCGRGQGQCMSRVKGSGFMCQSVNSWDNTAVDSDTWQKCFTVRFICLKEPSPQQCFLSGTSVITRHSVPGSVCKPEYKLYFVIMW